MAVKIRVPIDCKDNRDAGKTPRAYLEQLSCRSWIATLYPEIENWLAEHEFEIPSGRVENYRDGIFTFHDHRAAMWFKVRWL